jgi:hypothetical protein
MAEPPTLPAMAQIQHLTELLGRLRVLRRRLVAQQAGTPKRSATERAAALALLDAAIATTEATLAGVKAAAGWQLDA